MNKKNILLSLLGLPPFTAFFIVGFLWIYAKKSINNLFCEHLGDWFVVEKEDMTSVHDALPVLIFASVVGIACWNLLPHNHILNMSSWLVQALPGAMWRAANSPMHMTLL